VSLSISRGQLSVGFELQLPFGEVMIRLGLLEGRLPAKPARAHAASWPRWDRSTIMRAFQIIRNRLGSRS